MPVNKGCHPYEKTMLSTTLRLLLLSALIVLLSPTALAESADETKADPREATRREFEAASQGIKDARRKGPADIPFLGQAVLHVPAGYAFVPNPAAARFMTALGNRVNEDFLGLILPEGDDADWVATLSFEKSGYIKDDDAKSWNVDDMLKSIKESAEETNQDRASRGIPELDVQGWAEPPDYDAVNHRLVWALTVGNRGAAANTVQSVNYNTYALGREGFFSLNLVTASNQLEQRKPIAAKLLAALDFDPGKRYEDFNADTDHTAEYGLAALVGGAMVAKKFGLFALASLFIAKFGKIIAIAAAALFGFFGRRKGKKGGSLDA
jgi:uncharacterized membrane-anchored protein